MGVTDPTESQRRKVDREFSSRGPVDQVQVDDVMIRVEDEGVVEGTKVGVGNPHNTEGKAAMVTSRRIKTVHLMTLGIKVIASRQFNANSFGGR
ncbi:hypothetical protein N7528_002668 [Penicillium herquei]|nr:hypothetical protein N7528_002668 [Penicillium herquei]